MKKIDNKKIYEILYGKAINGSCMYRKYAAMLVNNNQILSVGYATTINGDKCNNCPRNELISKYGNISEFFESCRVIHAEICAILNCKKLDEVRGSDLYLLGILNDNHKIYESAFPCENCLKVIQYVGIRRINVFSSINTMSSYEVNL